MLILELLYMLTLVSVLFLFMNYLHKKGKLKVFFGVIAAFVFAILSMDSTDTADF